MILWCIKTSCKDNYVYCIVVMFAEFFFNLTSESWQFDSHLISILLKFYALPVCNRLCILLGCTDGQNLPYFVMRNLASLTSLCVTLCRSWPQCVQRFVYAEWRFHSQFFSRQDHQVVGGGYRVCMLYVYRRLSQYDARMRGLIYICGIIMVLMRLSDVKLR